jgi:hypothetical protein
VVEFEFQPWKKIIVHEVVKFPLQHFISSHSLGVQEGGIGRPLLWVNGIVFEHRSIRDTDDIIREKLEGKLHWSNLHYGILEKYQPEIKVTPGNIRIPVINIGDNKTFREMATWILNTFETKNL